MLGTTGVHEKRLGAQTLVEPLAMNFSLIYINL